MTSPIANRPSVRRRTGGLYESLLARGMSRRTFLAFSASMATVLALPVAFAPRIAAAIEKAPRLPVVWLRGQSCGGETASFLRAADPTAASLLLDVLSVDYQETLMAASGSSAQRSLMESVLRSSGRYLAVVEGAIPSGANGSFAMVGGRAFADVVRDVCDGAAATFAVGGCAVDGGLPGAHGGATGAIGVRRALPDATVLDLPGCPVNVENLAAAIVHYVTFGKLPAADRNARPLFAYGGLVHNQCERRAHFEFGEFATTWGDEGAQKGWCLYKLGCKGPETFSNCPTVKWGQKASWPVGAGHGCIGCTMPAFWDSMGPVYDRLPSPLAFAPEITADQIGVGLVGAVAGGALVHAAASVVRDRRVHALEAREAGAALETTSALEIAVAPEPATTAEEVEPSRVDASPVVEEPAAAVEPRAAEDTGAAAEPPPAAEEAGGAPEPQPAKEPSATEGSLMDEEA